MKLFRGEREAKKSAKLSDQDLHTINGRASPGKEYTRAEWDVL